MVCLEDPAPADRPQQHLPAPAVSSTEANWTPALRTRPLGLCQAPDNP